MRTYHRRAIRAQSLVEFALVGPLFFLMIFGTIEMGRAVYTNHQVANGAREGARYAAVHGSKATSQATSASVEAHAESKMTGVNTGLFNAALTFPSGNNNPGSKARVTATYTFTPIVSMVFGGVGSLTFTHTSEVVIKH